jgi:hypothetical protein
MTNAEICATPADLLYVVVYRRGGTANFTWHASLPMSQAEADRSCQEVERGGRAAFVQRYDVYQRLGLPRTYSGYAVDRSRPLPMDGTDFHVFGEE